MEELEQKLQAYFHFDTADLTANRTGQFSARQQTRLKAEDQGARKWGVIGGFFMLLVTAIGPLLIVSLWKDLASLVLRILFVLGFGVAWLWAFGPVCLRQLKRAFIKHDFKLGKAQGTASIVDVPFGRRGMIKELHIGGKRFVGTNILAGLIQGREAAVYYMDRTADRPYDQSILYPSEDVLSVELLAARTLSPATGAASPENAEIIQSIKQGDMDGAIRKHRAMFNSSFEEAKKTVELLKAELS